MKENDKQCQDLKREVARLNSRVSILDVESQTFKIALQSFGDALISTDTNGNILQMNTAAEEMTGWRQAKAIGQPLANVFRIVSEVTGDKVDSLVERLLHERIVVDWTNHTLLIAKDGSQRPIANCGAPVRNAKGEITGVVLVFRDQTAERATLKSLTESEARYRRLFEAARDGILILDANTGKIVDVNPFLLELTGHLRDDFMGQHLWEIGLFKDVASSKTEFATLQAKGYVRYEHLPLEGRDGRRIAVEFVSNVYLVDGQAVIQCNIRDITARKRSQRRDTVTRELLKLLNEQGAESNQIRNILQLIQQSTGMQAVGIRLKEGDDFPYCETDGFPDHFVQMERSLCTRDEAGEIVRDAQGIPCLECMCGNVLRGRTNPKHPFFTEGGSFWSNCTTDLLTSTTDEDGQARTLNRCNGEGYESVALIPIRCNGEIIGLLQLNDRRRNRFDLDMIRFLESAGSSIGIALARKRAQAEREELEKQLGASRKMEAIGSLAGGVAHDFNNLLSVILIYTEFATEGATDNVALKNDLVEVKIAADRAVALTQQLLAFSRKQVLQPVPLNLNEVTAGLQNMLQRVLGEDIDLVQMLEPDLGLTLADPSQIEQVLMNLVVNARDAMPTGGKLTIETSNVELDEQYAAYHMAVKPGSYVELVVTDTGHGMDEQTRSRIFEPFFTTKDKSHGTGLGLSTVYGIVKQSNGNIWVYSEPGTGTSFKIYLPRELSATTATAIEPSQFPAQATEGETILLVEDHEALRKAAKRTLDAAGYTVLTAVDGNDALLICSQHASDIQLLLSDVVMPTMSGAALAAELLKARPTLKVLYMSGYTDNTIDQHGVLPAGTHFIGKPFTSADLTRKVREVLDRK